MKMSRRAFSMQCASLAALTGLGRVQQAWAGELPARPAGADLKTLGLAPLRADVVVVGAGPSGIPAAIAAARQGARSDPRGRGPYPGGAPVNMFVSLLCGGPRVGIYREMAEALNARHDFQGQPVKDFDAGITGACNYWYLPSSFTRVLLGMIAQEKNLQLMCGARVVGALVKDGSRRQVQGVVFERQGGGTQAIEAAITIDATGTGLIAELAGCATMYGRDGRRAFNEPFGPGRPRYHHERCTWTNISQRLRPDAIFPREKIKGGGMVEHKLNHWVGLQGEDDYMARNAGRTSTGGPQCCAKIRGTRWPWPAASNRGCRSWSRIWRRWRRPVTWCTLHPNSVCAKCAAWWGIMFSPSTI